MAMTRVTMAANGVSAHPEGGSSDLASPVAEVRHLSKSFGQASVLQSIDLAIGSGEFIALLGASGSGKTTLLRIIAGLEPPTSGSVAVHGTPAVVFQEHRLLPWKRVLDNVALGVRGAESRSRAERMLEEVGLSGRERAWPKELSGGQAQRVALARALIREPDLLLLDEPFGSLDALTRMRMHSLVTRLWTRYRPAVLFVTHDVDEALVLADRLIVLSDGGVRLDIPVGLARPRRRTGEVFDQLRSVVFDVLEVPETI
jgi:sulfonate transport system ATP-binding protein